MSALKYAIAAPALVPNSAGCYALHLLNEHLLEAGQASRIITTPPTDDEIVVYTDWHAGNPHQAKHVTRLLLMFAGYFNGYRDFPKSELMYYYTPDFVHYGRDPGNILSIPIVKEDKFVYKPPSERTGSCYLAVKYQDIFRNTVTGLPADCTRIDMSNLYELFKTVKTLHTFDNSAINIEAALAGIEIVWHYNHTFMDAFRFGDYWDWNDVKASYEKQKALYFGHQLPQFIKRTQERFSRET